MSTAIVGYLKNPPKICPLCRGRGISRIPLREREPSLSRSNLSYLEVTCELCQGAKWVKLMPFKEFKKE